MASYETDCIWEFLHSGESKHVIKIEDYNGFWLLTLDNGAQVELHYRIREFVDVGKTEEFVDSLEAIIEADESLKAHVNRRL